MAPGPKTAKNCVGGSCAPYWTAATLAVSATWLAADLGDEAVTFAGDGSNRVSQAVETRPGSPNIPPEIHGRFVSAGTRARSGGVPLGRGFTTETRRHGEEIG
jgi:hypothetical protein